MPEQRLREVNPHHRPDLHPSMRPRGGSLTQGSQTESNHSSYGLSNRCTSLVRTVDMPRKYFNDPIPPRKAPGNIPRKAGGCAVPPGRNRPAPPHVPIVHHRTSARPLTITTLLSGPIAISARAWRIMISKYGPPSYIFCEAGAGQEQCCETSTEAPNPHHARTPGHLGHANTHRALTTDAGGSPSPRRHWRAQGADVARRPRWASVSVGQ